MDQLKEKFAEDSKMKKNNMKLAFSLKSVEASALTAPNDCGKPAGLNSVLQRRPGLEPGPILRGFSYGQDGRHLL